MVNILGWTATIIFNTTLLPQIVKSLKTKNIEGVSVGTIWLIFFGNIVAWCYAYMIKQPPLLFKYTVDWLTAITYLIIYYNLKRGNGDSNIKPHNGRVGRDKGQACSKGKYGVGRNRGVLARDYL